MTRWYESTNHMEDHAVLLQQRYRAEALARLQPVREGYDPEDRFTELVQQHVHSDDLVVDIGTGDGSWLMTKVTPLVRRAVGFDYAARRLWLALQGRRRLGLTNVEFLLADALRVPLRDGAATAIVNRRGPWTESEPFFVEGLRILAAGGLTLEISIGEENARELDGAFGGRSQMHEWLSASRSHLDELVARYRAGGLEPLVAETHVTAEVFPSREALVYRLVTSPAIEGFDPERDAPLVDRVIAEHGLSLTVHRICLVARKVG